MEDEVKIVECPRDAWQGLPCQIPPEEKAAYLRLLIDAGFRHIDAVSFVSPTAVPQMSDSEQVLARLAPAKDIEIIGIVVNEKGAERAIATGAVSTIGFPWSISSNFLQRNQHQNIEESFGVLQTIEARARCAGLSLVVYVSMAFGNPYGEHWSHSELVDACSRLADIGVRHISLADTVGQSLPDDIAAAIAAVLATNRGIDLGVHLHARNEEARPRIVAAYGAGSRRFDAAIGGLGGCPFAQDALVGNLSTETLIAVLTEVGAKLPALGDFKEVLQANARIAARSAVLARA